MPAAKGSKRTRTAAAEASSPPTRSTSAAGPPAPPSSNLAPARPMSAVAARRAAREAAAAATQAPAPARVEPNPSSSVAAAKDQDVDMRQRSPSPTSTPLQGSSSDEEEAEIVVPRKKAKVAASRYFASGGEEAGSSSSSSSSSLPKARTTTNRAPSEEQEDYTRLEEAGDVSAEWGTPRANRRRREKPSFIDPSCVSSLVPSPGENVVECQARIGGQDKLGTLFFLQADETILLRGVCGITPVWGAVSVLNATLRAAAAGDTTSPLDLADLHEDALHPLFVPNSHAVPPIRALRSATRPPPLRTADGRTLATPSGCAAIVLVSDLDTQVEGLERILAAGGIGHGLGFSTRKGKMPASEVSGRTWSLLVTPEPSYACLREDEQWQAALHSQLPPSPFASTTSGTDWRGDAFVAMVEGPKRVGKSTLAKLLVNELLDRYEAVAYLDTDLGQAEFTAPGFVSLTVLRRPVLGPSFTHLHESFESHFLGSTSPASDPTDYLTACEALLATYRLEVEFAGGDDSASAIGPGRRHKSRVAGPDQSGPSKCRERVPLVVNTSGWIKGLGADILSRLKDLARPTHVFTFADPATETSSFAVQDFPPPFPPAVPYRQIPLPAAFASPLESKWTPADLRTLALASYFYSKGCFVGGQVPRWETTRPLIAQPVRTCSWGSSPSALKASAVYMAGTGDIRYEHCLHALNGSIVAIVADSQPARTDLSRPFPYAPRAPLPSPASSRALGLAIVHSFAPAAESMYLLTPTAPTSSDASALALVKGALDTPVALMCDFTARADESEAGLAGVDWDAVPYLSVETGEAVGRRRVRRNLMRKGQA
ncbi:hypothetical protein JCM8115_001249 [Rhodotorula mucilaginosa]